MIHQALAGIDDSFMAKAGSWVCIFEDFRNIKPQIKTSSGVIGKARGCGQLFRVEVVTGHKANGALKAQNTDIAPGDIAVLAI